MCVGLGDGGGEIFHADDLQQGAENFLIGNFDICHIDEAGGKQGFATGVVDFDDWFAPAAVDQVLLGGQHATGGMGRDHGADEWFRLAGVRAGLPTVSTLMDVRCSGQPLVPSAPTGTIRLAGMQAARLSAVMNADWMMAVAGCVQTMDAGYHDRIIST